MTMSLPKVLLACLAVADAAWGETARTAWSAIVASDGDVGLDLTVFLLQLGVGSIVTKADPSPRLEHEQAAAPPQQQQQRQHPREPPVQQLLPQPSQHEQGSALRLPERQRPALEQNSASAVAAGSVAPAAETSLHAAAARGEKVSAADARWMHDMLDAGLSDGMGLDYTAQLHPALSGIQVTRGSVPRQKTAQRTPVRNKITLMCIDICPLSWMLGLDRFYLGDVGLGLAKLAVCVLTLGIGGIVWGLLDFIVVVANGLRSLDSIDALGMVAEFAPEQAKVARILAVVDLLMVPLSVWFVCAVWKWWRLQRMEKLKAAAALRPMRCEGPLLKGG